MPCVIEGDALKIMYDWEDNTFDCCITSPPYYGLRDYGHAGQIGGEKTVEEYLERVVGVMAEVRRVLKPEGTLWINLGDSYANDSKWGGSTGGKHVAALHGNGSVGRQKRNTGLKSKDLIGIPWAVAFALRSEGWYLRQDIIWHKPNPMPESVRDRCTKSHEYLFLMTKSERYYFDHEAMQEPAIKGVAGSEFFTGKTGEHQLNRSSTKPRTAGNKSHKYVTEYEGSDTEEHRTKAGLMKIADVPWETRNRRDVWTIATKPYDKAHFATFPPALIEPCVIAGCPPDGIILDPFCGSGTTLEVATKHGRESIGIEINPDYVKLSNERIGVPFA